MLHDDTVTTLVRVEFWTRTTGTLVVTSLVTQTWTGYEMVMQVGVDDVMVVWLIMVVVLISAEPIVVVDGT